MREIKFRAWSTSTKTMYWLNPFGKEGKSSNLFDLAEHDTWKVMQYTGLKDKNGKEIYEGDIVQYGIFALNDTTKFGESPWNNLPEGVNRDDITTRLSTHQVYGDIASLYALKQAIESDPDVRGLEVIGNIYENPELLEKL